MVGVPSATGFLAERAFARNRSFGTSEDDVVDEVREPRVAAGLPAAGRKLEGAVLGREQLPSPVVRERETPIEVSCNREPTPVHPTFGDPGPERIHPGPQNGAGLAPLLVLTGSPASRLEVHREHVELPLAPTDDDMGSPTKVRVAPRERGQVSSPPVGDASSYRDAGRLALESSFRAVVAGRSLPGIRTRGHHDVPPSVVSLVKCQVKCRIEPLPYP